MTATAKALGEFGWNGKTYIVLDVEGAKRYWHGFDGADGPETQSLLAKLHNIGALRQEGDNLNIVTLDEAKELGRQDATNAIDESDEVESPDGGWDNWLIQGVGLRGACKLLGEPESEQEGGWSDAMKAKLVAYVQGANEAAQKIEAKNAPGEPNRPVTVTYTDGRTENYASYEAALDSLGVEYGPDMVAEHDGDLTEGGDRTLVWEDEKSGKNDDGAKAVASIRWAE